MKRFKSLSKRPNPIPNPNAIRIKSNGIQKGFDMNSKTSESHKDLGNVGDPSTLAWLYCDIQPFGKVIIRKGNRPELPIDKPNIWVFCPLLKDKFPRDRCLVEECEKCSHYKGVNHSIKMGSSQNANPSWSPLMVRPEKKKPKISFTKEQLDKEEKELREQDEIWKKEEKEIFPKKSRKKVSNESK